MIKVSLQRHCIKSKLHRKLSNKCATELTRNNLKKLKSYKSEHNLTIFFILFCMGIYNRETLCKGGNEL